MLIVERIAQLFLILSGLKIFQVIQKNFFPVHHMQLVLFSLFFGRVVCRIKAVRRCCIQRYNLKKYMQYV